MLPQGHPLRLYSMFRAGRIADCLASVSAAAVPTGWSQSFSRRPHSKALAIGASVVFAVLGLQLLLGARRRNKNSRLTAPVDIVPVPYLSIFMAASTGDKGWLQVRSWGFWKDSLDTGFGDVSFNM